MRDPNRPVSTVCGSPVSHPDREERTLKSGSGKIARDGYSKVARRPRSRYSADMVAPERANEIESVYGGPTAIPFHGEDY